MPRTSTLVVVAAAVASVPAVLRAQAPRMAWGHPDLQGLWTNATLTPLQRPPELADKPFFSAEEMAEFDRQRRAQTNADRPLAPGDVGSYNDFFFERGAIVKTGRTSLVIDPPNGRVPELTPAARQRVAARDAWMREHPADTPADRWLTERCILFGATVPMLPEPYNNNYRIFQTPEHVTILVEMNHDARVIPLDDSPPLPGEIRQWAGDSRGRWEGDTLVVETSNFKFNEQSRFGVGYLAGISSEQLRVVERFTRTADDTLMYQATISDPGVFTQPWTVEIPMQPGQQLFEVACHEGNLGLANILSGHRAEERAAAEAARRER
jgi:hypothetical protein